METNETIATINTEGTYVKFTNKGCVSSTNPTKVWTQNQQARYSNRKTNLQVWSDNLQFIEQFYEVDREVDSRQPTATLSYQNPTNYRYRPNNTAINYPLFKSPTLESILWLYLVLRLIEL